MRVCVRSPRMSVAAKVCIGLLLPALALSLGLPGKPIRPKDRSKSSIVVATCTLGFGPARGSFTLTQSTAGGPTHIRGTVFNVSAGLHGWHVHEFGIVNLSEGCDSAGGHFNPLGRNHGAPDAMERHVGDLGNFEANGRGIAVINVSDDLISLVDPNIGVVDRTLVIHGGEDDLGLGGDAGSLSAGNSGPRIGCCEIKKLG